MFCDCLGQRMEKGQESKEHGGMCSTSKLLLTHHLFKIVPLNMQLNLIRLEIQYLSVCAVLDYQSIRDKLVRKFIVYFVNYLSPRL